MMFFKHNDQCYPPKYLQFFGDKRMVLQKCKSKSSVAFKNTWEDVDIKDCIDIYRKIYVNTLEEWDNLPIELASIILDYAHINVLNIISKLESKMPNNFYYLSSKDETRLECIEKCHDGGLEENRATTTFRSFLDKHKIDYDIKMDINTTKIDCDRTKLGVDLLALQENIDFLK